MARAKVWGQVWWDTPRSLGKSTSSLDDASASVLELLLKLRSRQSLFQWTKISRHEKGREQNRCCHICNGDLKQKAAAIQSNFSVQVHPKYAYIFVVKCRNIHSAYVKQFYQKSPKGKCKVVNWWSTTSQVIMLVDCNGEKNPEQLFCSSTSKICLYICGYWWNIWLLRKIAFFLSYKVVHFVQNKTV